MGSSFMKSKPFSGRTLFHFHTRFTDGFSSVDDYFRFAQENRVERIVFLEHIRKEPAYNLMDFLTQIREGQSLYQISASVGFEAKILPDGTLDARDEHLALAEVIGIAEHGFPDNSGLLQTAFARALNGLRRRFPEKLLVWVHPGLWFRRRGLDPCFEPAFQAMQAHAVRAGILFERNLKYGLISESLSRALPDASTVVGADAHSVADLTRWFKHAGAGQAMSAPLPSTGDPGSVSF